MSRKKQIWTACRIKKVHHNFWTAIQHCAALQLEEPNADVHIYKCIFCEGMHVTRGNSARDMKKAREGLARNLKVMSKIDFWYKADSDVVNHAINKELALLRKVLGIRQQDTEDDE